MDCTEPVKGTTAAAGNSVSSVKRQDCLNVCACESARQIICPFAAQTESFMRITANCTALPVYSEKKSTSSTIKSVSSKVKDVNWQNTTG